MNVEIFTLCDAATVHGPKLNMLGVFDTVFSEEIPTVFSCSGALRIRFSRTELGTHRLKVNVVDAGGNHIVTPLEERCQVQFPKGEERRTFAANFVLHFQELQIDSFGEYAMDLLIDGKQHASTPFFVQEVDQEGMPQEMSGKQNP